MMTGSAPAPAKFRFDLDLGHRQERNSVMTESAIAMLIASARDEGRGEFPHVESHRRFRRGSRHDQNDVLTEKKNDRVGGYGVTSWMRPSGWLPKFETSGSRPV